MNLLQKTVKRSPGSCWALSVNGRFATLLREERVFTGMSIEVVAQAVDIDRHTLEDWESGLSSPPAHRYYQLLQLYGARARTRAIRLDLQLLTEKRERHLEAFVRQVGL